MNLLDPVWGGFYRSAAFADWSGPSHEKLLADNALLLSNYLEAYLFSKDSTYKEVAEKVVAYMDAFLRTGKGWGFFSSQAGVVVRNNGLVDPITYFAKDDGDRRRTGIPAVQREVYSAANCYAASAYLKAGRILNRQELIDYAIATLDSLSVFGIQEDGLLRHRLNNPDLNDPLILADHVAAIAAYLDAYEVIGEQRYLLAAEQLSKAYYARFSNDSIGGLISDIISRDAIGRMAVPIKPYVVNAAAATNFVRLYYYTANVSYRQSAESIFLYLVSVPIRNDDLRLCSLTRTYLRITRFPTKLAMIGPRGDDYNQLIRAVFSRNFPRLILTHLGDGKTATNYGELKFAATDRAQLFACGEDTLSLPITAVDSVEAAVREFQISLMNKK